MQVLKQSTITTILVGPVLDASGLAVTTAAIGDFNITKNGTSTAMSGNTINHSHNGHYTIALTAANTDTLGRLTVSVNNSAMAMAPFRYTVLSSTAFDTLVTNGTLASSTSGRTIAVDASGILTDTAGTTTLLGRLTSTRAGLLDNLDVAISVIQSQITAQTNLSAKTNWFGSALLEIPDSGTRAYIFELVIKDDEDKLVNLDGLPTIALVNAAGTDRSSLITTSIANIATGRYTLTITVGTSTTNEMLVLRASGTISGETRYAVLATQVVDYDSGVLINSIYTRLGVPATSSIAGDIAAVKTSADAAIRPTTAGRTITVDTSGAVVLDPASVTAVQSGLALEATSQSIKTKTDNLPTDPADQSLIIAATDAVMARLGAPAGASVSADVAAVKSDTASLLSRLTANAATAIQNLFHMITGTGASSKYTVAALENAPASGGGGDAEQDTLLEVQTTVNALALSLAGTSVTVTSRVSGSEITAYIGDDYKVRSGTELEITVSDTGGALHTKLAAIGTSNLYFGASLPRKDPGQITGTISSLSYASNVLTIAVEITACASGLTTGDYTYQIQSSQAQGEDFDDFIELEGTLVVKQRTVAVRG